MATCCSLPFKSNSVSSVTLEEEEENKSDRHSDHHHNTVHTKAQMPKRKYEIGIECLETNLRKT